MTKTKKINIWTIQNIGALSFHGKLTPSMYCSLQAFGDHLEDLLASRAILRERVKRSVPCFDEKKHSAGVKTVKAEPG